MLSLGEAKVMTDALSNGSGAKKVRMTPRIKNCIPSSSNLTKIINVLKLAIESTLDQESKEAPLEGEYFKKKN